MYICLSVIKVFVMHRKFSFPIFSVSALLLVFLWAWPFSGRFAGVNSPSEPEEEIEWISIEEAAKRNQKNPKKIFIDVYTDWCGWCKKMDRDTFSNPGIAAYVNKNYYAVKLNAEGKAPITLNGTTYNFRPENRSHDLAIQLLQGKMSYPTTVYLDENFNMLSPLPGYLTVEQLNKVLRFYGDNHYKKQTYPEFEKNYSAKK